MIFRLDQCKMIPNGTKTQACWIVKKGEVLEPLIGMPATKYGDYAILTKYGLEHSRIKWQVGRDYAVQSGRGKRGLIYADKNLFYWDSEMFLYYPVNPETGLDYNPAMFKPLRILITNIDMIRLSDMTTDDFEREGGYTRDAFIDVWNGINKKTLWESSQSLNVWRLRFEVVR